MDYSAAGLGAVDIDLAAGSAEGTTFSDTFASIEWARSSRSDDTITGSSAEECLEGGSGADMLASLGGGDERYGEDGNDTLAGAGEDLLEGGDGADVFVWTEGDAARST